MPVEPGRDRSTPKQNRPAPDPRGTAPGPLLAVMVSLILIMLVAAWLTKQWQFVLLGLFGVGAGIVPFLNRRQ